jgi:hypothetical protein
VNAQNVQAPSQNKQMVTSLELRAREKALKEEQKKRDEKVSLCLMLSSIHL